MSSYPSDGAGFVKKMGGINMTYYLNGFAHNTGHSYPNPNPSANPYPSANPDPSVNP